MLRQHAKTLHCGTNTLQIFLELTYLGWCFELRKSLKSCMFCLQQMRASNWKYVWLMLNLGRDMNILPEFEDKEIGNVQIIGWVY